MKYYAGIGSRKIPEDYRNLINEISLYLEEKGYTLRSGGANGTDLMFEEKVSNKEIYLPWKNFNKNNSDLYIVSKEALLIGKKYHPAWNNLNKWSKLLIGRNSYQILGNDLKTPSDFVVCYTDKAKIVGGTGQALRIAKSLNIKIFNLFKDNEFKKIKKYIGDSPNKLF